MSPNEKVVFLVILLAAFLLAVGTLLEIYGELECIDFNKPLYQHIHATVSLDGESPPGGIGLAQGCFREIHTHFADHWIHIESNAPKNFTMGEFFELWGLGTKDRTVTINGSPASFNQTLNDMDKVVVISQRNVP